MFHHFGCVSWISSWSTGLKFPRHINRQQIYPSNRAGAHMKRPWEVGLWLSKHRLLLAHETMHKWSKQCPYLLKQQKQQVPGHNENTGLEEVLDYSTESQWWQPFFQQSKQYIYTAQLHLKPSWQLTHKSLCHLNVCFTFISMLSAI